MSPNEDKLTATATAELWSLAEAICNGTASAEQRERLNALLQGDEEAAVFYATYLRMHGLLMWHWRDRVVVVTKGPAPCLPALTSNSSALGFFGSIGHSTVSYFSQVGPFSYLASTMILCLMMSLAWTWKVSTNDKIASTAPSGVSHVAENVAFVGRITGMVDCRWSDASTAVVGPVAVPLGRRYSLSAGLLEITYDSGAKVILQGPATYEVDSATGGFLSLGKLTAKLEGKEERETRNKELSGSRSSFLIPHSYFAVRTPTATVTDLGTEFGVEVWPDREESVVVFQGQVQVAVCNKQGDASQTRTLQAGQSAQIDAEAAVVRVGETSDDSKSRFVRRLRAPAAAQPADVTSANLVLWLKADAIRGVGDGTPVGFWNDSSTRHNNMYHTSATLPVYIAGSSSGLNNMPVVRFDGTQQLSGILDTDPRTPDVQTLKTPFTIFSVVRNADPGGRWAVRGYFGGGESRMAFGMNHLYEDSTASSFWAWTPNGLSTFGQANSINTNWNIHVYVVPDAIESHWTWYCNGVVAGGVGLDSGTPQPFGETVYVGSSGNADEHWMGDVAELLAYDRAITTLELNQVGNYLAGKYGIRSTWTTPDAEGTPKNQPDVKP